MKEARMANLATETFGQARQGSVAAIIQVLNERLSNLGIRTRAVVADGMLQLLCEAATPEQLDKMTTIDRVRSELESISPQRIKKVKINSRIVKEEQLLWLEEINRDPENALLWSEIITLKRPFFIKRWIRDRNLKPAGPIFKDITEPEPSGSSLSGKFIGGLGLLLLLGAVAWLFRQDLSQIQQAATQSENPNPTAITAKPEGESVGATSDQVTAPIVSSTAETPAADDLSSERTADTTPETLLPSTPIGQNAPPANGSTSSANAVNSAANAGNITDVFAEAVRIAEQAAINGQTATTAAEWLEIAARWQKASELMANVPKGNPQYVTAQDRIQKYQANSQAAQQKANAVQGQ